MKRRAASTVALLLLLGACTTTTVSEPVEPPDIPNDLLHDAGAARRALAAIEEEVGITPAQVTDISIYPEYMIIEAQDPEEPDHIDSYTWRDDDVAFPDPVHLSGPQEDIEASLYPTSALDLRELPDIVRAAERELEHASPTRIEEARATYLYIQRDTSLDGRVVITISISGPRRSGSVETSASGEILEATVN